MSYKMSLYKDVKTKGFNVVNFEFIPSKVLNYTSG